MSAYKDAAVWVIEALAGIPGFEWDDDDLADCAQAAVKALEEAGWRPAGRTVDNEGERA